ncbi:ABC transporter permease [Larkinella ripae]
MKTPHPKPPRWAQTLLRWYCRPELLEDLEGDMNEYFERNLTTKGARRARLIYCADALKFFRLYTIRKPDFLFVFIHWIMIGSYLKTSRRSLVRNKLFSLINIFGLAVSMSVGLLIIAFLTDVLTYDRFHEKRDRIYRVFTTDQQTGQPAMNLASTSAKAGLKIRETLPGIDAVTLLRRGFGGDALVGETAVPLGGLWADEHFFQVFTFPMVQGDPATALKEPYSLVLTEKSALKLFGETNVLGKTVRFDTFNYVVTGVLKDIPKLSHLRFESLASFSTAALQKTDSDGDFLDWRNIYSTYIYLVSSKNQDVSTLQANLDQLSTVENSALKNRVIGLSLQPLKQITLGKNLGNPIGPTMNIIVVWVLGGLAFVVILSACFNYTNLSIARSFRRSREVGIRKVIGARRSHVLGQFIAESVLISLLALVLGFVLFLLLRPEFMALAPQLADLVSLEISFRLLLFFIVFAVAVGFMAGFLPALFFSRIKAIQVLKDVSSLQLFRHVTMRKALIVVQYVFSLMFITATLIGYRQYRGFLTFDLGFSTKNILNIDLQGNKSDVLLKELAAIPAVDQISKSRIITSLGSIHGMQMKYKDDSAGIWLNYIDGQYLHLHDHQFLAGKNFTTRPTQGEETEVIVNEQILKRFNIGQRKPNQALGEQLTTPEGKKLTIVGVVKDFHYGTLMDKIEPTVFRYFGDAPGGYLNAKITTNDWPATLEAIEQVWQKVDKIHPLKATFYDEQLERAYSLFSVMVKVIGFLAALTISIASLGLFGMVVFTTETRLKEISIRKILGANEFMLIYLLSKGFLLLLVLAALIALPATWLFFDRVVLANFAYHIPLGLAELGLGLAGVLVAAFLMIGFQTLKAARSNPAAVLKKD